MVDIIAPIRKNGETVGFPTFSIVVSGLTVNMNSRHPIPNSYTFLMTDQQLVFSISANGLSESAPGQVEAAKNSWIDMSLGENPQLVEPLGRMALGEHRVVSVTLLGQRKFIADSPIPTDLVHWRLGICVPELFMANTSNALAATVTENSRKVPLWMIIAAVVATLLSLGLAVRWVRRIVDPIRAMAEVTTRIQEGDLNQQVDIYSKDEIGILAPYPDTHKTCKPFLDSFNFDVIIEAISKPVAAGNQ